MPAHRQPLRPPCHSPPFPGFATDNTGPPDDPHRAASTKLSQVVVPEARCPETPATSIADSGAWVAVHTTRRPASQLMLLPLERPALASSPWNTRMRASAWSG